MKTITKNNMNNLNQDLDLSPNNTGPQNRNINIQETEKKLKKR